MSAIVTDLVGQRVRIGGQEGVIRAVYDGGPGIGLMCVIAGPDNRLHDGFMLKEPVLWPDSEDENGWRCFPVQLGAVGGEEALAPYVRSIQSDPGLTRYTIETAYGTLVVRYGSRVGVRADGRVEVWHGGRWTTESEL